MDLRRRRPKPARRARPVALVAALVLLAAAVPVRAVTVGRIPFQDCRLEHPAGLASVPARCGELEVAENPAEPAGRRIVLRIALLQALDRSRAKEPLFLVAGGPGQAATDFYAIAAGAFGPVRRTHDLVLIDQRGTGGSNRLRCDFPPDFDIDTPTPAQIRALSAECRTHLPGRPEFYTTSMAVSDLEAVRAALGFPAISLYGISYGTRVVQHYVRRHPDRARAVVLDGILPPDRSPVPETPFAAERALRLMFARCHADAGCEHAFPDLAQRFDALRAQLGSHPVHLRLADPATGVPRDFDFDASALAGTVRLLNYYAPTTALLPFLLDRAARGDMAALGAQLLVFTQNLDEQLAYGMNVAVSCTEDAPLLAATDRAAAAKTYLGTLQVDGLVTLCEGWPRGVVDADLSAPLDSRVPALLLSGEADPVTPPAFGERAAAGFRDHVHVVVPGQGHGQLGTGCAPELMATFLTAGTARGLDVRCLKGEAAPPFVLDYAGPAP